MTTTRAYRNGNLEAEGFPVADISEWLARDGVTVWLDLWNPTQVQLEEIGEELGLHELAIEDAVDRRQRPKFDRYENHLFVNAYSLGFVDDSIEVRTSEVALFVTANALVTVRHSNHFDSEEVASRCHSSPDLLKYGVGYLLYTLIDYMVDSYFAVMQRLDEEAEQLGDEIFDENPKEVIDRQRRTYELRRSGLTARRIIIPMREVVNSLMRPDLHIVSDEMMPYYRDVYDHVLRAADNADNLRDLVTTIRETQLTIQSNRMNLIMKQVTSWAAIIAVPTAITGWYGQNLPFPGYGTVHGFWTSTGLIIGLGIVLYIVFRRRDWL